LELNAQKKLPKKTKQIGGDQNCDRLLLGHLKFDFAEILTALIK